LGSVEVDVHPGAIGGRGCQWTVGELRGEVLLRFCWFQLRFQQVQGPPPPPADDKDTKKQKDQPQDKVKVAKKIVKDMEK
jgi:hypothetical protein